MKKQSKKHGTNLENKQKISPGAIPEPTDSRDEPKAPQKVAERAHGQPRRGKGSQKNDTNTLKETTKAPQGCEKRLQGLQKEPKMMEKQEKERQVETLLFKIEKSEFYMHGSTVLAGN